MFPKFHHISFYVQVIDTEHLVTAGGNPESIILCIFDVSVVGIAYVCAPNRCSVVDDRSPNCLVCHQ